MFKIKDLLYFLKTAEHVLRCAKQLSRQEEGIMKCYNLLEVYPFEIGIYTWFSEDIIYS